MGLKDRIRRGASQAPSGARRRGGATSRSQPEVPSQAPRRRRRASKRPPGSRRGGFGVLVTLKKVPGGKKDLEYWLSSANFPYGFIKDPVYPFVSHGDASCAAAHHQADGCSAVVKEEPT